MSGSTYDNFSNAQAARLDALKETSKMVAGMKGNGALAPLAQNGLNSLQVTSVIELAQFVIGESESEDVNIVINASYEAEEELSEDMPVEPAPTDADRVRVGLTEPSVNVTETPDLSTEDAGASSERTAALRRALKLDPAPVDVDPDEGPDHTLLDAMHTISVQEADLARVTKERDDAIARAESWRDANSGIHAERDALGERLDALRDRVDELLRERQGFIRERDEWRARHKALRDDVEEVMHEHRTSTVSRRLADALARDTERAES